MELVSQFRTFLGLLAGRQTSIHAGPRLSWGGEIACELTSQAHSSPKLLIAHNLRYRKIPV